MKKLFKEATDQRQEQSQMPIKPAASKKHTVSPIEQINYPISQIDNYKTIVLSIIRLLLPLQMLLWAGVLQNSSQSSSNIFENIYITLVQFEFLVEFVVIIVVFIQIILALFILLCKIYPNNLLLPNRPTQNMLLNFLHCFTQVCTHLTAFSCFLNVQENIIFFIISVGIQILSVFMFENCVIRRDCLYLSSLMVNSVLYALILGSYTINMVTFYVNQGNIYQVGVIIEGLLFIIWYFTGGVNVYISSTMKKGCKTFISLIFSATLLSIEKQVYSTTIDYNYIIKFFGLAFIIFVFICFDRTESQKYLVQNLHQKDIKFLDLSLTCMPVSSTNQDINALKQGVIHYHKNENCLNPACSCKSKIVYDPLLKHDLTHESSNKENHLFLKFVLKCIYQSNLNPDNYDTMLNYCQFLYNQLNLNNQIFTILVNLQHEGARSVNFMQKLRIIKLKSIISNESIYLNSLLYDGTLQIQSVFTAYEIFNQIQQNMKQNLNTNIQIWSIIKEQQISLEKMYIKINQSKIIAKKLKQKWDKLKKFLPYNNVWKYMYLFYKMYVVNQKLNQKQLSQIFNCIQEISAVNRQTSTSNSIKSIKKMNTLFESNASYFKAKVEMDKIIITQSDISLQKLLQFQKEDLKEVGLSIILPQDLKEKHETIFKEWLDKGYCTNSDSYVLRETVCINSHRKQIPVFKCYKIIINIEDNQCQFICMIKPIFTEFSLETQSIDNIQSRTEIPNEKTLVNNQKVRLQKFAVKEAKINFTRQSNIFLKQQCFQPTEEISDIKYLKNGSRLGAFVTILTVIILMLINLNSMTYAVDYSNRYTNYLTAYKLPFVLGAWYFRDILNIGTKASVLTNIQSYLFQFQQIMIDETVLKLIFDSSMNTPAILQAYSQNSSKISELSELDLIFLIQESVASLTNVPINKTSSDFLNFRQFLMPAFNKIFNNIKYNLHYTLQSYFSSFITVEIYFIVIRSILLFMICLLIIKLVINFFEKNKNIWTQISEFNQPDIQAIYGYVCSLFIFHERMMSIFAQRPNQQIQAIYAQRIDQFSLNQEKAVTNINLNKKNKNILFESDQNKVKTRIILKLIIALIIPFVACLGFSIYKIKSFQSLQAFQLDGFDLIQYHPVTPINSYGCLERLYFKSNPDDQIFTLGKYDDEVALLKQSGQEIYITILDPSSNFYKKRFNYFSGNPCAYNPGLLASMNMNVTTCQSFVGNLPAQGLSASIRWAANQSVQCQAGQMTLSQFSTYSNILKVIGTYSLDLMQDWGVQLNSKLSFLNDYNYNILIFQIILIVVVNFLIVQFFILTPLKNNYKLHRKVFLDMIPEYILIRQKIIRQRFIELSILKTDTV